MQSPEPKPLSPPHRPPKRKISVRSHQTHPSKSLVLATDGVTVLASDADKYWHVSSVALPFDPRDPDVPLLREDLQKILCSIFPTTYNVTWPPGRGHLVFQTRDMPSTPWPVSIGGLPYTVASETQGRVVLFPPAIRAGTCISICTDDRFREWPNYTANLLHELASQVVAYFKAHLPGVEVKEVMLARRQFVYVFVDDSVDILKLSKLPNKIAHRSVYYANDRDLHRPSIDKRQALCDIVPSPSGGIVDDTPYDTMRPGVLICSGDETPEAARNGPPLTLSSSGVLVQDHDGNRYMTAASHRIGASGKVWLPRAPPSMCIGSAARDIPYTDICLVELDQGVSFDNTPFEPAHNGSLGDVRGGFTRLMQPDEEFTDDTTVYLDSPYNGPMASIIVSRSVRIERSLSGTQYLCYNWTYDSQPSYDRIQPMDGTCGSVIWSNSGIVLGFYQFYISEGSWAGFSASVAASELVKAGFDLV